MKIAYPNLYEFFAGYFHQDWHEESPLAIDAVKKYLNEFPENEIAEASKELRGLLTKGVHESELAHIVTQLGCYYNPQADEVTYQEWLLQLSKLFERHILEKKII